MCEQVVGALGASAEAIGDLTVALTEACSNVIRHARDGDDFQVDVELGGERCELVVSYRDDGFDPLAVGVAAGDQLSESGRGLMLMRALVDELDFNFDPGHTRVRMIKHLDFEGESSIRSALQGRPASPSRGSA
jgi:serine/threonine-protein kinase RsbW